MTAASRAATVTRTVLPLTCADADSQTSRPLFQEPPSTVAVTVFGCRVGFTTHSTAPPLPSCRRAVTDVSVMVTRCFFGSRAAKKARASAFGFLK